MRWLLLKDIQILRRSPLLVALLVLYPIVIAGLVGFAVTSGPSKPKVAFLNEVPREANVVDLGGERVDVAKEASPLFNAIDPVRVHSRKEALQKVRDGEVLAALIVPQNLTQKLQAAAGGTFEPATVEVYYNAEDPAKRSFVENTIQAQVQKANAALTKRLTGVAVNYLGLITDGGTIDLFGRTLNILGLNRSVAILTSIRNQAPPGSRPALDQVINFARLAADNLSLSDDILKAVGTPISVKTTIVKGGSEPLGAFAIVIAVAVTLMFVTLLLAAGALALEREENAFRRLVRGLVSRTGLLAEKVALAAFCSTIVGFLLLAGLSIVGVHLGWGRVPLWFVALGFGALAFGAMGVAMGALAREVRAASLLAFMASLPIAVLALVPSGAVGNGLYDVIRVISALFPFKPTLDALNAAVNSSGDLGGPLLHLTALTVVFLALARLGLRRFA
ncbi:MAG: type transport system permease protein [Thermoleophilales bacterium]|nr:type transport system permease protein [Thermoleophilales bacterium]